MLTAFGYDWVPGNFAGGLVLERAGEAAVRVDIGYFIAGKAGMSGGTMASTVGAVADPSFGFRDGRVQTERGAKRVRSFQIGSKKRDGVSVGSSEHFALPRVAPQLREVNAYLGWFGPLSRPMQVMSMGTTLPGVSNLLKAAGRRFVKGSTGGPDAEARSKSGSQIVAIAYDSGGRELAQVSIAGVDGYTFTGRILAWGAQRVAEGGLQGTGALGPVDGFGLGAADRRVPLGGPRGEGSAVPAGACRCRVTPRRAGASACWGARRCWPSRRASRSEVGTTARRPSRTPGTALLKRCERPCDRLSLRQQVGQLTVSSFQGTRPPAYIRRRLRAGETAGVILFGFNAATPAQWRAPDGRAPAQCPQRRSGDGRPGGRRGAHGGMGGAGHRAAAAGGPRRWCAARRAPPRSSCAGQA